MTTDKTPATLAVDVLAVMRRCANVSTCNAQRHGGTTLKKHADEVSEARAAVAELIEATESIADHYDMDGYGPTAWKSLALEMADKARTALARVKGA